MTNNGIEIHFSIVSEEIKLDPIPKTFSLSLRIFFSPTTAWVITTFAVTWTVRWHWKQSRSLIILKWKRYWVFKTYVTRYWLELSPRFLKTFTFGIAVLQAPMTKMYSYRLVYSVVQTTWLLINASLVVSADSNNVPDYSIIKYYLYHSLS